MAMNRVDRIVLDPIRTYACTRTAHTGVRVTVRPMLTAIRKGRLTLTVVNDYFFRTTVTFGLPFRTAVSVSLPFRTSGTKNSKC